jgi:hypothetical protein
VAVNALKAALGDANPKAAAIEAANGGKAIKLETDELLTLIRQQLGDRLRFNIYTQQHRDYNAKPIQKVLSTTTSSSRRWAIKVSKELAA